MRLLGPGLGAWLLVSALVGCGSDDGSPGDPGGAGGVAAGASGSSGQSSAGSSGSSGHATGGQSGSAAGGSGPGGATSTGGAAGAGLGGKSGSGGAAGGPAGAAGAGGKAGGAAAGGSGAAGSGAAGGAAGGSAAGGAGGKSGGSGQSAGGAAGGAGAGGTGGQAGAGGQVSTGSFWPGVNLSGGENVKNGDPINTKLGYEYFYPTAKEFDYYQGKGLTTIRLPFRWKRVQHELMGDLDATELGRLDKVVALAQERGMRLILDPHDYASYDGHKIGSAEVPDEAFADFWQKLAAYYKGSDFVVFGLMNEPSKMKTEQWLGGANAAIAAIRKAGAKNLILVPGNGYTGAHSWTNPNAYGSPNGTVMLGVVDPENNFVFEVHQYFDSDSSGQGDACVSKTIGSERLKSFTAWLKQHNYRGFLGEFGIPYNDTCYAALDDLLTYIDQNRDVWLGWTYWAGGYAMQGYQYSVEPTKDTFADRPPMKYLEKHAKMAP